MTTESQPNANSFIRLGYARAFQACGHEVNLFGLGSKPLFDIFDEFEPDLLWTQTYNVTPVMVKCIKERPALKVIMKGSDWGEKQKEIDLKEYPILVANEKEVDLIRQLKEDTNQPTFIHGHYHPNRIQATHGYWTDNLNIPVVGLMSAADIYDYTKGQPRDAFKSDITFVGGYWGYKAKTLNRYLLRLCTPNKNYNIKIFGNTSWGVPQFCGTLPTEYVKDALASATICPNVSEKHSQDFGYDIVERPWKILSNKCFCISDYVESMEKDVFTDNEIVYGKTPEEFEQKIIHFLKNSDERLPYIERGYNTVINYHTYFSRIEQVFKALKMEYEAINVQDTYNKIKESL